MPPIFNGKPYDPFGDWVNSYQPPEPDPAAPTVDTRPNTEKFGYRDRAMTFPELQSAHPDYISQLSPAQENQQYQNSVIDSAARQRLQEFDNAGHGRWTLGTIPKGLANSARKTAGSVAAIPGFNNLASVGLNTDQNADVGGALMDDAAVHDRSAEIHYGRKDSDAERFAGNVVTAVADLLSVGGALKKVGLGVKTYLATVGMRSYDQGLKQADEAGLDSTQRHTFAAANAGAEVITEGIFSKFGLGALNKMFPVKIGAKSVAMQSLRKTVVKRLMDIGKTAGQEGIEEGITQIAQNGNQIAHGLKPLTMSDIFDGVGESVGTGAAVGGIVGGASHASEVNQYVVARQAQNQRAMAQLPGQLQQGQLQMGQQQHAQAQQQQQDIENQQKYATEFLKTRAPSDILKLSELTDPSRTEFSKAVGEDVDKTPNRAIREAIVEAARQHMQQRQKLLDAQSSQAAVPAEHESLVASPIQSTPSDHPQVHSVNVSPLPQQTAKIGFAKKSTAAMAAVETENAPTARARTFIHASMDDTTTDKQRATNQEVIQAATELTRAVTGKKPPTRIGKLSQKWAAGQASHATGVIRQQGYGEHAVQFHEQAHFMWRNGIKDAARASPNKSAITKELGQMGHVLYDHSGQKPSSGYQSEGFSEFMALWNLNPGKAQQEMPHTEEFWKQHLEANPKVKAAALKSQKLGSAWYGQGAMARADAQLDNPTRLQKVVRKLKGFARKMTSPDHIAKAVNDSSHFTTHYADQFFEKAHGRKPTYSESAVAAAEMARATGNGKIHHMASMEMINPDETGQGKGTSLADALAPLREVKNASGSRMKSGVVVKLFDHYVKAMNTIDLQSVKGGPIQTGMSVDDAQHIKHEIETNAPQIKQSADGYFKWQTAAMDYFMSKDKLYKKLIDEIRASRPGHHYSPLSRSFATLEDTERKALKTAAGSRATWGKITGTLHGSDLPTNPILEQTLIQIELVAKQVGQRQVIEALSKQRDMTKDYGHIMEKVRPDHIPHARKIPSLLKAAEEELQKKDPHAHISVHGISDIDLADAVLTSYSQKQQPTGSQPIFARIDKDNNLEWNHIHPEMLAGLDGLEEAQINAMHPLEKILLAFPARMLKGFAVGPLNPKFAIKNIFLDIPAYLYNSRSKSIGPHMLLNYVKSVHMLTMSAFGKQHPVLKSYSRSGLMRQGSFSESSKTAGVMIKEITTTPLKAYLDPSVAWSKYVDLAQITETVSRLAEYKNVGDDMGVVDWEGTIPENILHAMSSASRNVTGDSTRKGTILRYLDLRVPFSSVGYVHARSATKSTMDSVNELKQGIVTRQAVRRGIMMLGTTAAALALWYKNKDKDWWKEQTDEENKNWLRLNKEGYRMPVGTELGLVSVVGPIAAAQAIWDGDSQPMKAWLVGLIEQMTPLSRTKLPPAVSFALEQAGMNQAVGGPVVPKYLENAPAGEQVSGNTSKAAAAIGAYTGISPVRLEHADQKFAAGWVTNVVGEVERRLGLKPTEASDTPLVGQFIDRDSSSKTVGIFYNKLEAAAHRHKSELSPETEKEKAGRLQLENASAAMSVVRKQLRAESDPERLVELRMEINNIAKLAVSYNDDGRIDRTRFLALEKSVKYKYAESDDEGTRDQKQQKILYTQMEHLSDSPPRLGRQGVTRDNLTRRLDRHQDSVETARKFLDLTDVDKKTAVSEFRQAVVRGVGPEKTGRIKNPEARSHRLRVLRQRLFY